MGFVKDDSVYFYVSMTFRFFQGLGNAMIQTACYAIITFSFSDNREKYLGYAEAFTGIGLMLGPVIGGVFYSFFGYFGCFACFSGVILLSMLVSLMITPNALNKNTDIEEADPTYDHNNLQLTNGRKIEVSFKMFLTNKRSLIAYLSSTIVCFFMSYQSSFLTEVLEKDKGVDEVWNGPILALSSVTYTISCFAVNIFSRRIPRRLLILISFLMLACSTILQGPSGWLGIPDKIVIVLIGFALNGVA
jgi:MFS family permease